MIRYRLSVIILLISLFNSGVVSADNNAILCKNRGELLLKLGMINREFIDKEYLTRSDCVMAAATMMYGLENNAIMNVVFGVDESDVLYDYFPDLPQDRADFSCFYNFYSNGGKVERFNCPYIYLSIVQGDEKGMRPDDLITWNEFVTLFVRVVNWDVYMFLKNDGKLIYPDSYIEMAQNLGIYPEEKSGYVTPQEACDFMYELLHIPVVRFEGIGLPIGGYFVASLPFVLYFWKIKFLNVYVENSLQEKELKSTYKIDSSVKLEGHNVTLFYHRSHNNQSYYTDAIILDNEFVFDDQASELPSRMQCTRSIKIN